MNKAAKLNEVCAIYILNKEVEAQPWAAEEEKVPFMDLVSKLEVVADFENLQDGLFTSSEWVNKAAKLNEVCAIYMLNKEVEAGYSFLRKK